MGIDELAVPFRTGSLCVRDYGGTGPTVLFVHAPGFCAMAFDQVAAALQGRAHAYALDLPGHGGSTMEVRRPSDTWEAVLATIRHLDLRDVLLVGLGQGSHTCLVTAIQEPDLVRRVVCFGGACVQSTERAEDDIAFYTSHEFTELLRTRFFFGYRLSSPDEIDELVERMLAKLATDWRAAGFRGLRQEVHYSVRPAPDGDGWVNRPTPASLRSTMAHQRSDAFYPDDRLYRRLQVPVLIVQLTEGLDQANAPDERALARRNRLVDVMTLDSGEYPHYTRTEEVAEIVLTAAGVDLDVLPDTEPAPAV